MEGFRRDSHKFYYHLLAAASENHPDFEMKQRLTIFDNDLILASFWESIETNMATFMMSGTTIWEKFGIKKSWLVV